MVLDILEGNNLKYFIILAFIEQTSYKIIHPDRTQRLW